MDVLINSALALKFNTAHEGDIFGVKISLA